MYFFIQIKDGQPINHPAYPANLVQAFGVIPPDWEPFLRVPRRDLGVYEVLESDAPTYQKVDGVWTDVWSIRPMTDAEKAEKQQKAKDFWATREQAQNWAAWIFNEATCSYDPPVLPPANTNKTFFWCGAENQWKDPPPYPQDGKVYKFDYFAWAWVEVVEPA